MRTLSTALIVATLCTSAWAGNELPVYVESQIMVRSGDDPAWSDPSYDESGWERVAWYDFETPDRTVWLRQIVRLPSEYAASAHQAALFLTAAAASEIWWDGELIGRNGIVGDSPDSETPGRYVTMFPLPPDAGSREHVLAVRLSSQHTRGRIRTPIDTLYIGALRDPLQWHQRYYLPSMILGGALGFAAVFLVGMSVPTRSPETLLLGLAGIAFLGQLGLETSRAFIAYTYDWHVVRASGVAACAWLAGLALLAYLLRRFREAHAWRWLICVGVVGAVAAVLATYPDPMTIFALAPSLLAGLTVSLRARRRGKPGAAFIAAGFAVLIGLLVVDPSRFLDLSLYLGFTALLLVFFVEHLRDFVRVRREREQAAHLSQRLRFELLKRSVQPHFLMNSLTTLAEWVEESPRQGVEMISALASELRLLGRFTELDLVTLDDEIGLCRAHLRVMEFRQDQAYRLIVNGPTADVALPPAVLHTLVENALSHNRYDNGAAFNLTVERQGGEVRLRFLCPAGTSRDSRGLGTGSAYVRARLKERFGDAWTLVDGPTDDGGWCSTLTIPALDQRPELRPRPVFTSQPES